MADLGSSFGGANLICVWVNARDILRNVDYWDNLKKIANYQLQLSPSNIYGTSSTTPPGISMELHRLPPSNIYETSSTNRLPPLEYLWNFIDYHETSSTTLLEYLWNLIDYPPSNIYGTSSTTPFQYLWNFIDYPPRIFMENIWNIWSNPIFKLSKPWLWPCYGPVIS